MSKPQPHFQRIVEEFAVALGLPDKAERLLAGERMFIGNYSVWLVHDAPFDAEHLFVHVDMGVPSDPFGAYRRVLRLNFELGAGMRGVFSLHPTQDNLLYSFRYPLVAASSGKALFDTLVRFAGEIGDAGRDSSH